MATDRAAALVAAHQLAHTEGPTQRAVWYAPDGVRSTSAKGPNQMEATPFPVHSATVVDALGVECITAAASSSVQAAIYSDDGTGRPGTLVAFCSALDTSTTGFKSVALSAPVTLPPGLYWLAAVPHGGAPTLRVHSGQRRPVGSATGSDVTGGVNGYAATSVTSNPTATFTVAGLSGNCPVVAVRTA